MTYTNIGHQGGESRDVKTESISGFLTVSTASIDTTAARIINGTRCVKLPLSSSASKAITPLGRSSFSSTTFVTVLAGYIGISALPSTAMGVLSDGTQGGQRYVRINTSGQIEIYDNAGVQMGHSTRATVSTTAMTHIMIVWDYISPNIANKAWVTVVMDGVLQWAGLCASTSLVTNGRYLGEYLPAATNRGADLYYNGLGMRQSATVTDVPHLAAYPKLKLLGGASLPPTAVGTHTTWTGTYTDVDDFPDAVDTEIASLAINEKETYTYSASNPLTSADTVHHVQHRVVAAVGGSGKIFPASLFRDASANETTQFFTSFAGTDRVGEFLPERTRPGGGSWVYTDFDLAAGVSNLQVGVMSHSAATINVSAASLPGPEIVCSSESMPFTRYLSPMVGNGMMF